MNYREEADDMDRFSPNAIAAAIRAVRAIQQFTQEEFADRMGVSVHTLRQLERGEIRAAGSYVLRAANAAGVTLEEFAFFESVYVRMRERVGKTREVAT